MRAPVSPITPCMDKLSETQSDTAGSRLKGNEILFGGKRSEGAKKEAGRVGGGMEGRREREGTRRIIETGRVQLGREIEMLSPSRAYHHQRQTRGERKNQLKSQNINMWSYAEKQEGQRGAACTRAQKSEKAEKEMFFYKHEFKARENPESSFIKRQTNKNALILLLENRFSRSTLFRSSHSRVRTSFPNH